MPRPNSLDDDACMRAYQYQTKFGFSDRRVARVFGVTDKTIKTSIARGRTLLADKNIEPPDNKHLERVVGAYNRSQGDELERLRIGVGRIAQRLGIEHEIPGYKGKELNFDDLALCSDIDRGWNRLCATIISAVDTLTS